MEVIGLVVISVFAVGLFLFGVFVSWKTRTSNATTRSIMIGNRDIGLVVGTITLSATWVGSAAIYAVAEQVYTPGMGLVWAQIIFAVAFADLVAAVIVVPRLSDKGFVTVLDPVQNKLGKEILPLFYAILLGADVAWLAAILSSKKLEALATPFVVTNEAVKGLTYSNITGATSDWLGAWNADQSGFWIDNFLAVGFGFCISQTLLQRVYAMKSLRQAQVAMLLSVLVYMLYLVPPVLIGASATNTNWNMTDYVDHISNNNTPIENGEAKMIFAIALKYLTPSAIGYVGLAAVCSAAMSTADSAILASASLFTKNIYKAIIRKEASDNEQKWAARISMVVITAIGAVISLVTTSIFLLYFIAADLLYIIVFPQIVATIYLDPNCYGSILSMLLTAIMRVLAGEPFLDFEGLIQFPGNEYPRSQFPVKTFLMVFCLGTTVFFSFMFKNLFKAGIIHKRYDFLDSRLSEGGRSYIHGKTQQSGSIGENILLAEISKQFAGFDE